ncbi:MULTISPECIES: DUF6001 family protein [unclassified Paraburkholderia]|uniref:DUF6001 family protein n=1 Tax=unclassified Paraburkholderia TaxID=2615204 RepID=UPI002AB1B881|nr:MULTISPECIES: DUF6001 family protein [unclassified Paraburkholderia]
MDYSTFHSENVEAFLNSRKLSFSSLENVAKGQYKDVAHTLVTSSPVHGVANAASDIDLICITAVEADRGAMASQIYHDGQHLETVAFALSDVDLAMSTLAGYRTASPLDTLRAYRRWDDSQAVSRKYLERIVSGVATNRAVPYLDWNAALGSMWAVAAYDAFRQSAGFALLALRAGEMRGAAAYSVNALLYLMNALLSQCGWTVSNKKWTLLRWRRAGRALLDSGALDCANSVDALWPKVGAACVRGLTSADASELIELVEQADASTGFGAAYAVQTPTTRHTESAPFLPGSRVVLREDGRAALLPSFDMPTSLTTAPRDLAAVSSDLARQLLLGARVGAVGFSLTDSLS